MRRENKRSEERIRDQKREYEIRRENTRSEERIRDQKRV